MSVLAAEGKCDAKSKIKLKESKRIGSPQEKNIILARWEKTLEQNSQTKTRQEVHGAQRSLSNGYRSTPGQSQKTKGVSQ